MNGPRWFLALAGLSLSLGCAAQAQQPLMLVTEEEARASQAAPMPFTPRTVPAPDAPQIQLLMPALSAVVPSPTRIQLRFLAAEPAVIVPDSFKVRYGSLRIDITARLRKAATVTVAGIDVAEARLPKGSHRLFVEIQDSAGRKGEQVMQFAVE